ncbi:MAG: HIT family protein [Candidatus Saccharimonadales bacterium]
MKDSIFTKIINGEIPCHKVYEDDLCLAFLDIHPVQPGHTLVISKQQVEFVWDLPDELYQALMMVTKKIALRLRDVTSCEYVHERIVGTDVPHAHIHLIPFSESSQLSLTPDMGLEPDHTALAAMAEKLRIS